MPRKQLALSVDTIGEPAIPRDILHVTNDNERDNEGITVVVAVAPGRLID
jgi:hypothetical protein